MRLARMAARNGFATFVGDRPRAVAVPARHDLPDGRSPLRLARAFFLLTPAPLMRGIGQLRAERAAWRAARRVPAYGAYLETTGVDRAGLFPLGILGRLPETDKASYVDRYGARSTAASAARSRMWARRSTNRAARPGTPYNWIRGSREREVAHRNIGFFARYAFGDGPLVTINAFSMGAWAAGFNMSLGMLRHGIVKSTGPDIDKILSTLAYLGPTLPLPHLGLPAVPQAPARRGRPPRLPVGRLRTPRARRRRGDDRGAARRPARPVHVGLLGLRRDRHRDRDGRRIAGVASPSAGWPVPVPTSGRALFGTDPRLPMVFQYNPLIHFMEVNDNRRGRSARSAGSTCWRHGSATTSTIPAGSSTSRRVRAVLAEFGYDLDRLGAGRPRSAGPRGPLPWARPIPLPFLWIHGRRDATISVMGANIYPEDIESVAVRRPAGRARLTVVHAVGRRRRGRDAASRRSPSS